jgi:hypothetical protein
MPVTPTPWKTYDSLLSALRQADAHSTADALERAAQQEADYLVALPPSQGGPRRKVGKIRAEALAAAKQWYLEEICEFYESSEEGLTSDMVLYHRRKPTAWAIARRLRKFRAEGLFGLSEKETEQ